MNNSFNLTSKTEPTDQQLEWLMIAVSEEAKKRALQANNQLQSSHISNIKIALEDWEKSQKNGK